MLLPAAHAMQLRGKCVNDRMPKGGGFALARQPLLPPSSTARLQAPDWQ
jgi:hypothetical protein